MLGGKPTTAQHILKAFPLGIEPKSQPSQGCILSVEIREQVPAYFVGAAGCSFMFPIVMWNVLAKSAGGLV